MRYICIAVHYSGDKKIGIRMLECESGKTQDAPIDNVIQVINSGKVVVEGLEISNGQLVGSNGSLDRYAKIAKGNLVGNSPLVVLKQLGDMGYEVSDWKGAVKNLRNEDVIQYSSTEGIANGKLVTRSDGSQFISAISGSYVRVELEAAKPQNASSSTATDVTTTKAQDTIKNTAQTKTESYKPRIEDIVDTGTLTPVIHHKPPEVGMSDIIDPKVGMTVEQKLTRNILAIRNFRSFYYSILANVNRRETAAEVCPTMGISIDTLFYNPEFVKELTMAELTFVNIHEVMHLAMQHSVRKGQRIHLIWNIACDMYINKVICEEFDINPGDAAKGVPGDSYNVGIKVPEDLAYSAKVDVEKDTPESIYDELIKNSNAGKDSQHGGGPSSGKSRNADGGTSPSESGQDGNGDGNGDGTGVSEEIDAGDKKIKVTATKKSLVYKGDKISDVIMVDIVESAEERELSDDAKQQRSRGLLERSVVMQKQIGSFGGEAGSFLERLVEKALAPKVNWRSLLKNKLTLASQSITTYAKPDKRFISRDRILPGPKKLENDTLENVKICIDTSGSIGDEDLGIALAQIDQLLNQFKATAEVLYWDTQVRKSAPFTNIKELLRIKPAGGGGTDVNCVFEHFDSREYRTGRKKPPSIIIIFTDGYFGTVNKRHSKYNDTIWVIKDNDGFTKPFGVMAKFKN